MAAPLGQVSTAGAARKLRLFFAGSDAREFEEQGVRGSGKPIVTKERAKRARPPWRRASYEVLIRLGGPNARAACQRVREVRGAELARAPSGPSHGGPQHRARGQLQGARPPLA